MQPAAEFVNTAPEPRRAALAALGVAVATLHLWLVDRHLPPRLGDGAAPAPLKRMDVAFVRVLAPTQPPTARARPARPAPRPAARAPDAAASAADPKPEGPLPPPPEAAVARVDPIEPLPSLPDIAAAAAAAAAVADSAPVQPPALTAQAFEWPPSTRLSYTLTGDYRGPVEGSARVEWLRSGSRYQVFMDVSAALVFSRRSSSEGELTAEGLKPWRYEEEDKIGFLAPRRRTVAMDHDRVRLADGRELPRVAGLQDSVSQLLQLTWIFTTQPEMLTAGRTIELSVALPRRVEQIVYEVAETQALATPAGLVETVHVKPRREGKAGSDLTVEFWVAPSLQYLPVRIVIRQDAQTHVDLLIERLPQQAERGR